MLRSRRGGVAALVVAATWVVAVAFGCGSDRSSTVDDDASDRDAASAAEGGASCGQVALDAGAAGSLSPLPPNESRYVDDTTSTNVARTSIVAGTPLPATFSVAVPRYIGPWILPAPNEKGRTLGDYVHVGALGKYARISFRVAGADGMQLAVETRSSATSGNWRALFAYDPDVAGSAKTRAVLAPSASDATLYEMVVPIEQLALAHARSAAEENDLRVIPVSIDAGQAASGCANLIVGAATIALAARAPVVLVHGINDTQDNCWADYADELDQAGFIADRDVSFAGLADKPGLDGGPPTFNGSVKQDVWRIKERLSRLSSDYGTTDVHLVGHSKGGLDFVNFLALEYPAMKSAGTLRVLSLQTLASPHGGSILSDIIAPLKTWAASHGYDSSSDWPSWGVVVDDTTDSYVFDTFTLSGIKESVLLGTGPIDPGLSDLRTDSDAVKTDLAWKKDPDIHFATYAWDADFERDRWVDVTGQLTTPPDPSDLTPKYSTDCRGNPIGSDRWTYYCIDDDEVDTFFWGTAVYPPYGTTCSGWNTCGAPLWRPMARGLHATVTSADATLGSRSTIHVDPYLIGSNVAGGWNANDLTVAAPSASHPSADTNTLYAGATPRSVTGLVHFKVGGGVEPYVASCNKTGANHISILRRSRANMVACTAADTMKWIVASAPLPSGP
jgi:hypothetical protein